jgi:2-polyprenyl-3-methyl-5-hydroxy-6-metoxy-1,4-benzoquinol methylase
MNFMNEESYDKIANAFVERRKEVEPNEAVVEFGGLFQKGDTILDVGCGGGVPNAKFLDNQGLKIVGIDISAKLLEEAKRNVPGGQFIKKDILDFESAEQFPGIIAWDSLFHLQPDEHKKAFKKLTELLRDNGYLLFTHGGQEGQIIAEMYGENFSYSSLGEEKAKKLLQELGFKVLKWTVDNSEGHGYMTALVKKLARNTV